MHPYRTQMQMVFQDPYSSLNPRMTVEDIIGEPLDVPKLYNSKKERHEMIMDLMAVSYTHLMAIDLTQTSYSTVPSVDVELGNACSDHSDACLLYTSPSVIVTASGVKLST